MCVCVSYIYIYVCLEGHDARGFEVDPRRGTTIYIHIHTQYICISISVSIPIYIYRSVSLERNDVKSYDINLKT